MQALLGHNTASNLIVIGNGWDALSYITQEGHIDLVKVLLDYSVDVNEGSSLDFTPSCYAAAEGHLAILGVS